MSEREFATPMQKAIANIWLIGTGLGLVLGIFFLVSSGKWFDFGVGVFLGLALAGVVNFILACGIIANRISDRVDGKPSYEEMKREWEAKQPAEPS